MLAPMHRLPWFSVLLLCLLLGFPASGHAQDLRATVLSIGSVARAQQLLRQGHAYLDRDGDGAARAPLGWVEPYVRPDSRLVKSRAGITTEKVKPQTGDA